jgi:flagellar export protein FliJ
MAKKFKFRLATVLKYRQILKDQQEAKLMTAEAARSMTEADIKVLDDKRSATYQSMIENLESGFNLQDQLNHESFNKSILYDKSKEKARLAKRIKAVEFETAKLVRKNIDLKSIEKLKDTAVKLHQKELLEEEMKQIDDLVNSRHRVKDK